MEKPDGPPRAGLNRRSGHPQQAFAARTTHMGTAATRRRFYELRADGPDRPVHCLMELEHPVAADPWLCWLEASVQAHKALQRIPTPEELREVTPQVARGLAKTVGLSRRRPG